MVKGRVGMAVLVMGNAASAPRRGAANSDEQDSGDERTRPTIRLQ